MLHFVQHLSLGYARDLHRLVEDFHMLFEVHSFGRVSGELFGGSSFLQLVDSRLLQRRLQLLSLQTQNARH